MGVKKQDELNLWRVIKDLPNNKVIPWEELFKQLNIHPKRGFYIIGKWTGKGILEYGVSLRTAWISDKTKWNGGEITINLYGYPDD